MKNEQKLWIGAAVVSLIIILITIMVVNYLNSFTSATITVQKGDVGLFVDGDFNNFVGQKEFLVEDVLMTRDGEALINIDKSHFIWVKPFSRITLKKLNTGVNELRLDQGSIWYKHVNLTNSKLTIKSSRGSAYTSGTSLLMSLNEEKKSLAITAFGNLVKMSDDFSDIFLNNLETGYKVNSDSLRKIDTSDVIKKVALQQAQLDFTILTGIRSLEIRSNELLAKKLLAEYGLPGEIIEEVIMKINDGTFDAQIVVSSIPEFDKLKIFTASIDQTLNLIKKLENEINSKTTKN